MEVFFYEAFAEEKEYLKKYLPQDIAVDFTWKTIQEHADQEPPAAFISVRTQSKIPASWSTKLSGILTRSTGYDHLAGFRQQYNINLPCGHLTPYCSRSVAEQALLLWMAILRNLQKQRELFESFNRDGLTGQECEQKTLLVVGVGNIGYEIVKIGRGLNMQVLGVDIVERHSSVRYVSIIEGLAVADIIVCAMNLSSDNINYFNYPLLKKTKPGAVFINISRGELSPSGDLLRLLEEKHLGGIGLDVFNSERELAGSLRGGYTSNVEEVISTLTLGKLPNVIFTPHNAFNTTEAIARKAKISVEQIVHFFKHNEFLWAVP